MGTNMWAWIQLIIIKIINMNKRKKRSEWLIGVSSGHSIESVGATSRFCEFSEHTHTATQSEVLVSLLEELGYRTYSPNSITDTLKYPAHLNRTVDLLNFHEVDINIELHLNSWSTANAHGCETLTNKEGEPLAKLIQEELINTFSLRDRGVKQPTNKTFLNRTSGPAIITEPLFMSNKNNATVLKQAGFVTDYCLCIIKALDKYIGIT